MLYLTIKIPRGCKLTKSIGKKCLKKEKIAKRAGACAIEFWVKCTRACNVRAAENRVCECACVRACEAKNRRNSQIVG